MLKCAPISLLKRLGYTDRWYHGEDFSDRERQLLEFRQRQHADYDETGEGELYYENDGLNVNLSFDGSENAVYNRANRSLTHMRSQEVVSQQEPLLPSFATSQCQVKTRDTFREFSSSEARVEDAYYDGAGEGELYYENSGNPNVNFSSDDTNNNKMGGMFSLDYSKAPKMEATDEFDRKRHPITLKFECNLLETKYRLEILRQFEATILKKTLICILLGILLSAISSISSAISFATIVQIVSTCVYTFLRTVARDFTRKYFWTVQFTFVVSMLLCYNIAYLVY